jgi:hypothetical protein
VATLQQRKEMCLVARLVIKALKAHNSDAADASFFPQSDLCTEVMGERDSTI